MYQKVRIVVGAGTALVALCCTAVVAFACIPIATLNLSQTSATPGSQVTATIQQISGPKNPPVVFHWGTVDGPVLATVTPGESGTTALLTIPSVTQSGNYLIVATSALRPSGQTWGLPARAAIEVNVPGSTATGVSPAGTTMQTGPAGLATESSLGTGALVLIAVGAAALGLLVVGGATLLAGRGATPEAETVRRS